MWGKKPYDTLTRILTTSFIFIARFIHTEFFFFLRKNLMYNHKCEFNIYTVYKKTPGGGGGSRGRDNRCHFGKETQIVSFSLGSKRVLKYRILICSIVPPHPLGYQRYSHDINPSCRVNSTINSRFN
jgi:hypothetical protein